MSNVLDENSLSLSTSLNYLTNLNLQGVFGVGTHDFTCAHNLPNQCLAGLQDNAVVTINRYATQSIVDVGLGGNGGQVSISPDNAKEMFSMSNGSRFYTFDPFAGWTSEDGDCLSVNCYATTMIDQTPNTGFTLYIYIIAGPWLWYKPVDPNCDWSLASNNSAPLPASPYMMEASNDTNAYVFYTVRAAALTRFEINVRQIRLHEKRVVAHSTETWAGSTLQVTTSNTSRKGFFVIGGTVVSSAG